MLNALVTAVADAFSVMTTTERPYRFIPTDLYSRH